jgi:hypothetical protein
MIVLRPTKARIETLLGSPEKSSAVMPSLPRFERNATEPDAGATDAGAYQRYAQAR